MKHLERAKDKIELLWAKGTDYDSEKVKIAIAENRMLHLDLDLTGNCKLHCSYCDRTPDRFISIVKKELTINERKNIILQAKELGAETIEFPGAGEPMLDAGFWEIIQFVYDNNMTPVVFTSGYHLDDDAIELLYNFGATIFLKYSSLNSDKHDKLVGVKGYSKTLDKVLNKLLDKGFNKTMPTRLAIDMVVIPDLHSMSDVENIFIWCRKNNIHNYISTLIPEGRADNTKKLFAQEYADNLINRIEEIDKNMFGIDYDAHRPMVGGYRCRQVNVGIFVNLYGEIYDCNGLGRFLGHMSVNSLKEVWNSKFASSIRNPLQDGYCHLRERVWDGIEAKGFDRKVYDYLKFTEEFGTDSVVENGLKNINLNV